MSAVRLPRDLINCYSKKVVCRQIPDHMRTPPVQDSLRHAAATGVRGIGRDLHSDPGSLYTSDDYRSFDQLHREVPRYSLIPASVGYKYPTIATAA